ncbi:uncharacterized protein LOC134286365 [Aedes albopictus]|uniref:THAP-type domain-containing protein n=1 Tax=Aedes albopictus TaxID=7160 RepID=A0ABM1ZDI8_AEDAL
MGRFCEVISCLSNTVRNLDKSFYKFPVNDIERHVCVREYIEIFAHFLATSFYRCRLWVKFCRSPDLHRLLRESGYNALQRKIICSDHFSSESLRDPTRRDRGLKVGAIPSLLVNGTTEIDCQCQDRSAQNLVPEGTPHYCNVEYLDLDRCDDGEDQLSLVHPDIGLSMSHIQSMNFPDTMNSPRDVDADDIVLWESLATGTFTNSCETNNITGLGELFDGQTIRMDGSNKLLLEHPHSEENWNTAADGISESVDVHQKTASKEATIVSLKTLLKIEREKKLKHKEEVKELKEKLRASQRKCDRRLMMIKSLRKKIASLDKNLKHVRKKTRP